MLYVRQRLVRRESCISRPHAVPFTESEVHVHRAALRWLAWAGDEALWFELVRVRIDTRILQHFPVEHSD